jgi:ribosomal protein L11 methyltransferase
VEYDADAAAAAAGNFELNGVSELVTLVEGDVREVAPELGAHDVVVANLTSGLISGLAGSLPSLVTRGGTFIASGMLEGDEARVRSALEGAGLTVLSACVRGEWLALCANFS